ncbi:hypothetical protein GUITHDRAFT_162800 [Guillardia theta CCMP2712]|uniref:Uncharacterized protein n=1 Tax=Guillardia theta (strain CCMP2712) TaxID=905079 RepID=L1JGC4_GUITC|nr:hypothetical protein GUITHDRAFT_162800 [Guillardia theta CCMP2712]EKX47194.1 hypothetical protein GUITHDRAFT_162800 [Guillardia theta CCMP2712]|eukprot:XP_005834174.1 hypothetical protein GUITHDRAFT_162800 [Guillardia theta CCMP2712]
MYHSKEESRTHRDGKDELVEELNALLSFVKSGFTSSNQQDSSQFLKSNAPGAEILRELYREVSALKSREASSENVLRVAKETLDARKKQIRTLTMTIKKLQGKGSLAGMGLSGSMDSGNLQASDTQLGDSSILSDLGADLGDAETKRAEQAGGGIRMEEGSSEKEEMKKVIVEQTSQIRALEEKLHYLEEDHRQRSERITEVSERLMQKRKEEREMIESLKLELNEKNEIIQKLQAGEVASFAEYDQQGYSQYPETRI